MAYNPATKSKQFLYGENEWIFSIKCGVQLIVLNVVNMMEMERKTTPGLRSNTSVYFSSLLLITSGTECVCVCLCLSVCVCVCGPIRYSSCSARPKAVGGDECLMDR